MITAVDRDLTRFKVPPNSPPPATFRYRGGGKVKELECHVGRSATSRRTSIAEAEDTGNGGGARRLMNSFVGHRPRASPDQVSIRTAADYRQTLKPGIPPAACVAPLARRRLRRTTIACPFAVNINRISDVDRRTLASA